MAYICLFCCTRIKSDKCEEGKVSTSDKIITNFLKVTRSHFRINVANLISRSGGPLHDKICFNCEQSLKSVCQLHRQLECIRLKMEWEIGLLISKMETVGRTPSKIKWLRRNQSPNHFQTMTVFRNGFISKCNQSLNKSKPKLVLKKIPNTQFLKSPKDLEIEPSESTEDLSLPIPTMLRNSDDNSDDFGEFPIFSDNMEEYSNDKAVDQNEVKYSPPSKQKQLISSNNLDTAPSTSTPKLPMKKLFMCSECPKEYSKPKNLLRHQINHHGYEHLPAEVKYDPQKLVKCAHTNCSASFTSLFQLKRHTNQEHDDNSDKDNFSKTTCPICGRICSSFGNLKFHMTTQHDDENPHLPLTCDVVPNCPKRFPNEAVLKWHRMFYYHMERKIEIVKCPECHRELKGVGALKKHLKKHQRPEAPYVCELCGAAFKSKSILRHHGLFHKGPDNWAFQCEECGKKCATKHRLKNHMQVHSTVKRYSCQACGREYNARQKLRYHINKFHAHEGLQDIPRKKAKPQLISRRLPLPSSSSST